MNAIIKLLKKYIEVGESDYWLLARFVLHTWIYDVGEYAMQILVLGDVACGKTTLLKVLSQVCYNAILVSGGSTLSAYRRVKDKYEGTLLINEFEIFQNAEDGNSIVQFLNAGFEKGNPVIMSDKKNPSKQDVFDPFCPKVLASRTILENTPALSRMVIIRMKPASRTDIPNMLPPEFYEETETLRNQLLLFRLKHWKPCFELPPEVEERLRLDPTIGHRTKQTMLPVLTLACLANQDVEEVFQHYRNIEKEKRQIIQNETPEGQVFNELMSIVQEEERDEDEYSGLIAEDGRLVGVSSKLLAERTGLNQGFVSKVLKRIGMVSERVKRKVRVYRKDIKASEVKTRVLRRWVFKTEEEFLRAYKSYYAEPETHQCGGAVTSVTSVTCPEPLRSISFVFLNMRAAGEASGDAGDAGDASSTQAVAKWESVPTPKCFMEIKQPVDLKPSTRAIRLSILAMLAAR